MIHTIFSPIRKCGKRVMHGMYAVGGESGSENGVLLRFNRLNPPVPYQVKLHRGPRIVDADAIFGRKPMEEWWMGSSADAEQKKSADGWGLHTFGMTIEKRITVGECEGATDADEAIAALVSKIRLDVHDPRLTKYFQELTLSKIQELPRVAEHYNSMHEHLALFVDDRTVGQLMEFQAAIWRTAYSLPPQRRGAYIPYLMRFLVLLNLQKDAIAMKRMFPGTEDKRIEKSTILNFPV